MTILSIIISFFATTLGRNLLVYGVIGLTCLYGYHRIKNILFPQQPTLIAISAKIKNVDSGNQFQIESGLFGRKTRNVTLCGISVEDGAKENLINLMPLDKMCQIEITEGNRIISDVVGIVYAPNGTNANLDQLRKGLARNTSNRKDFVRAEKEAKTLKLGIWKDTKHRWFDDDSIHNSGDNNLLQDSNDFFEEQVK